MQGSRGKFKGESKTYPLILARREGIAQSGAIEIGLGRTEK
jgi:hypothetical protein